MKLLYQLWALAAVACLFLFPALLAWERRQRQPPADARVYRVMGRRREP